MTREALLVVQASETGTTPAKRLAARADPNLPEDHNLPEEGSEIKRWSSLITAGTPLGADVHSYINSSTRFCFKMFLSEMMPSPEEKLKDL